MVCKILQLAIQILDKLKQCRLGDTQALEEVHSHKHNRLGFLRCPLGLKILATTSHKDLSGILVLGNKQHNQPATLVLTSLPNNRAMAIHQLAIIMLKSASKFKHQ